jgi:hypothetical protein
MRLIVRFLAIARQHEYRVNIDLEGWVARPLNVSFILHFSQLCRPLRVVLGPTSSEQ